MHRERVIAVANKKCFMEFSIPTEPQEELGAIKAYGACELDPDRDSD